MPSSTLRIGLNPYGLTHTLGLQGAGTPRQNLNPLGVLDYLNLAVNLGAASIEFHLPHLELATDEIADQLRQSLQKNAITPVVSCSPPLETLPSAISQAIRIGATVIRVGLSTVLEGARAECEDWAERVAKIQTDLPRYAAMAAEQKIDFAIEDHQDFGSEELLNFAENAGENVGICFDTGNPLAVGEAPIEFALRVAHRVKHVHLKDYISQPTHEGYRLIRCAIGDGTVPLPAIEEILRKTGNQFTATMEPGAMDARHIRLLTERWWNGYPPRSARELASCVEASRKKQIAATAENRTPWELGLPHAELIAYESDMLARGTLNMRNLGWL